MEKRVNLSRGDNSEVIRNDVASVLDFLCDALNWPDGHETVYLTPSGMCGLWKILNTCSETLKQKTGESAV